MAEERAPIGAGAVESSHHLILLGAALIALSIFAGQLSSRFGAPLLLVFLALGMLAGEDGPGGILFADYQAAFLIGSVGLAIILFDGGLRTSRQTLQLALGPAVALASIGVVITALIVGVAAVMLLDLSWPSALLIGSIIASTDAAAVFGLLRLKGMAVQRRTAATLEAESGLNDPIAVFLTVLFAELAAGAHDLGVWDILLRLVLQMAGGAAIGLLGGAGLTRLINRLTLAPGLYPIFALSGGLVIFAGALAVGASGFLAVYVAGVVLGNSRHREAVSIDRFHDGLAWLSQITLFLMLGLLVTPHDLVGQLGPALGISAVLMFLARPLAVWICLAPFRFTWQEIAFIAWVGLRGAVPIYLATIPVLSGLPGAIGYLNIAFVAVLTSLVLQGWTVAWLARALGLELPPAPEPPLRQELGLPQADSAGMVIAGYEIAPGSTALKRSLARLPMPADTRVLLAMRQGAAVHPPALERFEPGDYVLVLGPEERQQALDRLFGEAGRPSDGSDVFGEFTIEGSAPLRALALLYNLPVDPEETGTTVAEFVEARIDKQPVVGDRVNLGEVELVVREVVDGVIRTVGIELEPEERRAHQFDPRRLLSLLKNLRERIRR
jgi:cell volume regulation protein A